MSARDRTTRPIARRVGPSTTSGSTRQGSDLESEPRRARRPLETGWSGENRLEIETSAFRELDDADHGGQPALKTGGALARAQRLDTVVIRYGT